MFHVNGVCVGDPTLWAVVNEDVDAPVVVRDSSDDEEIPIDELNARKVARTS
jgi:hypothetical protein